MAALIRKAHEAKLRGDRTLSVWGTGTPRREFLHVDDAARAMVFLVEHYSDDEHVNVGVGEDLTILELAWKIMRVVGFEGEIVLDPSKPDGTPRKLVKTDKLFNLGWRPRISLDEGLESVYHWYLSHAASGQADLAGT
jgi:GDP-L-fucose synthase